MQFFDLVLKYFYEISAIPRPEDGKIRARTTDTTPTATRTGWFSSVFVEA